MTAERLVAPAPAKVNLWLHVVGRRPDGYHLLDSLVVFPRVGDTIEAEPSRFLSLTVDGPFAAELGAGADNIVLRAAEGLAAALGRSDGAALRLVKRLPVASGVGGGSTDAAATLSVLLRLWNARIDVARLHALALSLGADVPACLFAPASVFLRGVGEEIASAPALPGFALLLVNPGAPVATPRVFAALATKENPPPPDLEPPTGLDALVERLEATRNDLEAPAIALAPTIADVLARLRALPFCRFARMSGSGATCFGVFAEEAAARAGERAIREAEPRWWTGVGRVDGASLQKPSRDETTSRTSP